MSSCHPSRAVEHPPIPLSAGIVPVLIVLLLWPQQGYNPAYGARPLRRAIMRLLEDSMAERMLAGEIKARWLISCPYKPAAFHSPCTVYGNQIKSCSNFHAGGRLCHPGRLGRWPDYSSQWRQDLHCGGVIESGGHRLKGGWSFDAAPSCCIAWRQSWTSDWRPGGKPGDHTSENCGRNRRMLELVLLTIDTLTRRGMQKGAMSHGTSRKQGQQYRTLCRQCGRLEPSNPLLYLGYACCGRGRVVDRKRCQASLMPTMAHAHNAWFTRRSCCMSADRQHPRTDHSLVLRAVLVQPCCSAAAVALLPTCSTSA